MCALVVTIVGLIALIRGKISLWTRMGEVKGLPARLAGGVLILPLPLSLMLVFLFGVYLAASGKPIDTDHVEFIGNILQVGVLVACILTATLICAWGRTLPPPDDYHEPGRWKME